MPAPRLSVSIGLLLSWSCTEKRKVLAITQFTPQHIDFPKEHNCVAAAPAGMPAMWRAALAGMPARAAPAGMPAPSLCLHRVYTVMELHRETQGVSHTTIYPRTESETYDHTKTGGAGAEDGQRSDCTHWGNEVKPDMF